MLEKEKFGVFPFFHFLNDSARNSFKTFVLVWCFQKYPCTLNWLKNGGLDSVRTKHDEVKINLRRDARKLGSWTSNFFIYFYISVARNSLKMYALAWSFQICLCWFIRTKNEGVDSVRTHGHTNGWTDRQLSNQARSNWLRKVSGIFIFLFLE